MLDPAPSRWVLDASVVINLLATATPGLLLGTLGVPCVVPEVAVREIRRLEHPSRRAADPRREVERLLAVETRSPEGWETFSRLTGAPRPDDLGDGESAVLALAIHGGGACLLDDRKCVRIARARVPPVPSRSTVDLLAWALARGVPTQEVAGAAYDALRYARMRVPAAHGAWVAGLLGERAREIPALGRYLG